MSVVAPDDFVVGQRYKIHYKKELMPANQGDPNRYYFVGTLSEERPGGPGTTVYVFTDITYQNGQVAEQHTLTNHVLFGELAMLAAVRFIEGGRRRRRNTRKRNTRRRRNTRRHRA